jgi:hypothetical protein
LNDKSGVLLLCRKPDTLAQVHPRCGGPEHALDGPHGRQLGVLRSASVVGNATSFPDAVKALYGHRRHLLPPPFLDPHFHNRPRSRPARHPLNDSRRPHLPVLDSSQASGDDVGLSYPEQTLHGRSSPSLPIRSTLPLPQLYPRALAAEQPLQHSDGRQLGVLRSARVVGKAASLPDAVKALDRRSGSGLVLFLETHLTSLLKEGHRRRLVRRRLLPVGRLLLKQALGRGAGQERSRDGKLLGLSNTTTML